MLDEGARMNRIRICLVGAGRAGMVHALNFRQRIAEAELVAIVDADLDRARGQADALGLNRSFDSIEAALTGAEFDAVCIATPTFTHSSVAVAAARAGKHLLCEKPMALTLEEADSMIAAARQANVVLQIAFMRRFDPAFQAAKEQIDSGAIGDPIVVRTLTRGPGLPPRWACDPATSIGMLAEVNSHDFDTIRWLSGSEFSRVYAEAATLKAPQLGEEFPRFYDTAVVNLRLTNGALAVIDGCCPAGYGYDARAEVLGSKGVLFIGELQECALVQCTREEGMVSTPFTSWARRFEAAYLAEDEHFLDCIRTGASPAVTGEDGRRALEGVLAATRSLETNLPVSLPLTASAREVT
jgi:myo-inositol 2-dehydrogenase/D-chiro-inositol 1-dehydrogenase/scyllo-inositol 2-dehydrogenase (NAD+)